MMGQTMKSTILAATSFLAFAGAAAAEPVVIDDTGPIFSESITSTAKGDIIIGSSGKGTVYRAAPGETKAKVWISPEASGMKAILGVFAWEPTNTLFACQRPTEGQPETASALRTFDLKTGAARASYPLPGGAKALCNDIAVGKNGDIFVAETLGGQILRLKKGATALETWAKTDDLAFADGVAIAKDGAVVLNSVRNSRMFKIAVKKDGTAGEITELKPSLPIKGPDGLRSLPDGRFLQAEGAGGRIAVITVKGDEAIITPIKSDEVGLTAMTYTRGKVWGLNAKFALRNDPAMKDKDPGPFISEPYDLPKK
jgi:sugar lactone lactonase YvrE